MEEEELAKAQADLENPDIPDEAKKGMRKLLSLFGKRPSEIPPLTLEEEAERLEGEVLQAANEIVRSWLNVLCEARRESGDKQVRLDGSLLPPPELPLFHASWDEELAGAVSLTVERIRELMALYATKLVPVFDLMIANNPKGFELFDGIIVCKDADGFYLPPETKDENV